jgi:CheY-like chemotaxis protein
MEAIRTPRILCIEDVPDHAARFKEALSAIPAEVDIAGNGDQALDFLTVPGRKAYDLIVLDVRIPRLAGGAIDNRWGVNFMLHHQKYYSLVPSTTPVIVFTAYPLFNDCVECIRAGARDYLPKLDPYTQISNLDLLVQRCTQLLHETPVDDTDLEWISKHEQELSALARCKYAAPIPAQTAKAAGVSGTLVGGRVLIEGDTIEEIKRQLLVNPILRWERPRVVKVAKK